MNNRSCFIIGLCLLVSLSTAFAQTEQLGAEERRNIEIFNNVSGAVVFIKSAAWQRDFFSLDIYEIPQGAGSGFIWSREGYIITNFHVIYAADKIEVVLANHNSYPAKVVGASADYDLAVLKIDAPRENLIPVPRGASHSLMVGQKVLIIGNPFGLDHSLSTGVVSALGRSIASLTGRKINDVIQTDAAINPGNSGGPVLDSSGNLIGVATAIYSLSGAYAGVGFAIPVDTVTRVIPQLIKYGQVKRVGLGVSLVPDVLRERMGISGAMIMQILKGSAAESAGLKPMRNDYLGQVLIGDIIVGIDGQEVSDNDGLAAIFEKGYKAGDKVKVEFLRDGKRGKTQVVLQEI